MLEMLRDLVAHNGHANATVLNAVHKNTAAMSDGEVSNLLHHIVLANRFWLLTVLGLPFVYEEESQSFDGFETLIQRFRNTHEQQSAWLETATESSVARVLQNPLIPSGHCSVWQAFIQVCMHSHGHRAQCVTLLRRHGGIPPPMDFILWLTDRPAPEWPLVE